MARYKDYCYEQGKMIPISFREQIVPGTFEHTLSHLIDHELDLSVFDARYCNDDTGRSAYDPALLLKIVLYAYSRGITSSRQIERCCRENVIFMALSADTQPHFTTITDFISRMEGESGTKAELTAKKLKRQVKKLKAWLPWTTGTRWSSTPRPTEKLRSTTCRHRWWS